MYATGKCVVCHANSILFGHRKQRQGCCNRTPSLLDKLLFLSPSPPFLFLPSRASAARPIPFYSRGNITYVNGTMAALVVLNSSSSPPQRPCHDPDAGQTVRTSVSDRVERLFGVYLLYLLSTPTCLYSYSLNPQFLSITLPYRGILRVSIKATVGVPTPATGFSAPTFRSICLPCLIPVTLPNPAAIRISFV